VHPVGWRRQILHLALEMLANGRRLAGCGRTQNEDIEVVARHVGAELDGLECALLADEAACGLELGGGFEAERRRIDGAPQFRDRERRVRWRGRWCDTGGTVTLRRDGRRILFRLGGF